MFIGHLPMGYLVTTGLLKAAKIIPNGSLYRRLVWTGMIASVAPDIDLIYYYLIDHRQTLHHHYFTHTPYFWSNFFLFTTVIAMMSRSRAVYVGSLLIMVNTVIHLFLDTIVGKIRWAFPFSWRETVFFDVPAVYDWWVLNFIFHWTFLIECAVVALAGFVFWRRHTRAKHGIQKQSRLQRRRFRRVCTSMSRARFTRPPSA